MQRVATMLGHEPRHIQRAMQNALLRLQPDLFVMPCRALRDLLHARPDLIVVGRSARALQAAIAYRRVWRRSRLIVWLGERPGRGAVLRRLAVRLADGVLLGAEAALGGSHADGRVFAVPGPFRIAPYLSGPAARDPAMAHRIVIRDSFALDGGALEMLAEICLAAERDPGRTVHLEWVGDGELHGVLAAQLLPDNMIQRFHGAIGPARTCEVFRGCGVLVSADGTQDAAGLAEVMASGLVVVFNQQCRAAALLEDGTSGLGFELRPGKLADVLGTLFALPPDRLDAMRGAARMRVLPMDEAGFAERVGRAVQVVLRDVPPTALRRRQALHPVAETR